MKQLAGSVIIPKKFKGLSTEKIIKLAKKEYFKGSTKRQRGGK